MTDLAPLNIPENLKNELTAHIEKTKTGLLIQGQIAGLPSKENGVNCLTICEL